MSRRSASVGWWWAGAAVMLSCNQPSQTAEGSAPSAASQPAAVNSKVDPASVPRIEPRDAQQRVRSGHALLVCAYALREKCDALKLKGSIPWAEFEKRLPTLSKSQEIILYCS